MARMIRWNYWWRQTIARALLDRLAPAVTATAWVWRRLLVRTTFVAVTGSMGKTTTKECVAAVLSRAAPTFRSYRTQNAYRSTALNVLRVRPWHRFAVLEIGASGPGTLDRTARLVRPDAAVILSVRPVHLTEYASIEEHAAEKAALLRHLRPGGPAFLNDDDPRVAAMRPPAGSRVIRFGSGERCDHRATGASAKWPDRLRFRYRSAGRSRVVRTQLVGEHWVASALAALAVGDIYGVGLDKSARALASVSPTVARLSPHRTPSGAVFLRDDHGAPPPGLEAALRVLEQAEARRRWLVITDLSDLPGKTKIRRRHVATRLPGVVDAVVFIGRMAEYGARRAAAEGLPAESCHAFSHVREAAEFLRGELGPGDLVLLKGRSVDHVERVFFAQFDEVGCWKERCSKRMLCDICWEIGTPPRALRTALQPEPAPARRC